MESLPYGGVLLLGVPGITLDRELCPWKVSLASFEADVFCWKTNHPDTWIPFWWFCKLELHSKKTCSLKIDLAKRKVSQPPFFSFKKCTWIPFGWYLVLCKNYPTSGGVNFNSLEVGTPTTSPIPRRCRNQPIEKTTLLPKAPTFHLPRRWSCYGTIHVTKIQRVFFSGRKLGKTHAVGGGRNPVNSLTHPVEVW